MDLEKLRNDVRSYLRAVDPEQLRDSLRAYLRVLSDREGQKQLAKRIGISDSWLNKYLCGQFPNLRSRRLRRLAEFVDRELSRNTPTKAESTHKTEQHQTCATTIP